MSKRFAGTVFTLLIFFVFLIHGCVPAPPPPAVPEDEDNPPIMAPPPGSGEDEPTGIHNSIREKYYFTIQEAIDDSQEGDVIVVQPGTYYENLRFTGSHPKITVKSTATLPIFDLYLVNDTIIDGRNMGPVVTFERNDSTLRGFTIKGGRDDRGGGGISVTHGSNCTIILNMITDNIGEWGGGIRVYNADASISNNMIYDNIGRFGGGIYVEKSTATSIRGNTISNNPPQRYQTGREGGGIYVGQSVITIADNTIIENGAMFAGGGIYIFEGMGPALVTISNNTIIGNYVYTGYKGGGIYAWSKNVVILSGNTIKDNYPDNIATKYGDLPR